MISAHRTGLVQAVDLLVLPTGIRNPSGSTAVFSRAFGMVSAGRRPDEFPLHSIPGGDDGATQHKQTPEADDGDALTHRPRGLAAISRQTLANSRSGKVIHKSASVTEIHPRRSHQSPRQKRGGQALDTDLRPLVSQLIAIAEKLRKVGITGTLDPESFQSSSRSGSQTLTPPGLNPPIHYEASDPDQARERNLQLARATYAKRRKRTAIFKDPELFGEPAWDILLDLYIAQIEQKPVSVSSACIGSSAPPTTGLRWLGVLAEQGLVLREHDPQDQRRVLVRLTERAMESMDEYFASSASILGDRRAARA